MFFFYRSVPFYQCLILQVVFIVFLSNWLRWAYRISFLFDISSVLGFLFLLKMREECVKVEMCSSEVWPSTNATNRRYFRTSVARPLLWGGQAGGILWGLARKRDVEQAYVQASLGGKEAWATLPKEFWRFEGFENPVARLVKVRYNHLDSGTIW